MISPVHLSFHAALQSCQSPAHTGRDLTLVLLNNVPMKHQNGGKNDIVFFDFVVMHVGSRQAGLSPWETADDLGFSHMHGPQVQKQTNNQKKSSARQLYGWATPCWWETQEIKNHSIHTWWVEKHLECTSWTRRRTGYDSRRPRPIPYTWNKRKPVYCFVYCSCVVTRDKSLSDYCNFAPSQLPATAFVFTGIMIEHDKTGCALHQLVTL